MEPMVEVLPKKGMAPWVYKLNSNREKVLPADAVEAIVGARAKVIDVRLWPWGDLTRKSYAVSVRVNSGRKVKGYTGGQIVNFFVGHANGKYWFVAYDPHIKPSLLPHPDQKDLSWWRNHG